MNSSAKQEKNNRPSMALALHLNGFAGIVTGNIKQYDCGMPIHQIMVPIVYFHTKNERLLSLEKSLSKSKNISSQSS